MSEENKNRLTAEELDRVSGGCLLPPEGDYDYCSKCKKDVKVNVINGKPYCSECGTEISSFYLHYT